MNSVVDVWQEKKNLIKYYCNPSIIEWTFCFVRHLEVIYTGKPPSRSINMTSRFTHSGGFLYTKRDLKVDAKKQLVLSELRTVLVRHRFCQVRPCAWKCACTQRDRHSKGWDVCQRDTVCPGANDLSRLRPCCWGASLLIDELGLEVRIQQLGSKKFCGYYSADGLRRELGFLAFVCSLCGSRLVTSVCALVWWLFRSIHRFHCKIFAKTKMDDIETVESAPPERLQTADKKSERPYSLMVNLWVCL